VKNIESHCSKESWKIVTIKNQFQTILAVRISVNRKCYNEDNFLAEKEMKKPRISEEEM
jgi:hypothetical protein